MATKEAYKVEIESIINILGRAKLFHQDTLYLSNAKSDKELSLISKNRILHQIRYSFWVLTVLELCKLYDDNDTQCYNFFKFIRKVKQDKNKLFLKNRLPAELIDNWEKKLYDADTTAIVKRLKDLRDTYYAHSDRNPRLSPEELTPNIDSIEKLLLIGQEIIFDFKGYVFDVDQDFKLPICAGLILDEMIELENYKSRGK